MNFSDFNLKKIHFIGIGGSGMSGIAEVLNNLDYDVSGSDINDSKTTKRLASLGIKVFINHNGDNLDDVEMVVVSSAIDSKNPEIIEARKRSLPILARAEMLSGLMNMKRGIAVAGTHGKTTVTSLLASIFTNAKLDPTFINGGIINSFNTNAKLGSGEYLIAEADESDKSFLMLQPSMAIITNIEADHLVNYDNSFEKLKNSFIEFTTKLPFNGIIIVCGDDRNIRELLPMFPRKVITYGFNSSNDFQLTKYLSDKFKSSFYLNFVSEKFRVELNMPGRHNVLNACAAIILSLKEGISKKVILSSLKEFEGINRRLQYKGSLVKNNHSCIVIDDYGHHPTEIECTLEAVRNSFPKRKIIMVFQPHRFTRTNELYKEFIKVLSLPDTLILLDVFSAGEKEIKGSTSKDIYKSLEEHNDSFYIQDKEDILSHLIPSINRDSVILMQGAGDISKITETLIEQLKN
tara:strand:- start:17259 stop:18647 length:1389 start_codon:yes stop_codon:yes gene_type:complete